MKMGMNRSVCVRVRVVMESMPQILLLVLKVVFVFIFKELYLFYFSQNMLIFFSIRRF